MAPERTPGHEVEAIFGEPRDRHIRLDTASPREQLGIDDLPRRHIHIGTGKRLQEPKRPRTGDLELGEGGEVGNGDTLADGCVLRADQVPSVRATERQLLDCRLSPDGVRVEPVGPFPAELRPVHRALRTEYVVERATALTARPGELPIRIGDLVVVAVRLYRAGLEISADGVRRSEPTDVERPQVHPGVPVDDPIRHGPSGSTGSRYAG